MANKIQIDVNVDDKGTTKKVGLNAKKLGDELEGAAKGAGTLDRNLKGAAGATSNATKGFAKMAQGMGGLVSVYATIAANVFALSAAFEFLKRAAEVKMLEESQKQFGATTGLALTTVTAKLREASNGMLGFREAAQAATIAVAKGFSPEQINRLAESAGRAAAALGRDYQDAFDRLIRGVSKAEPELLDELGVTLRLEKATKDYAAALGLQADKLTDVQRSQAILFSTQKQLDAIFGTGPAPENKFVKLGKTFEDLVKDITQFLLPAFEFLADVINNNSRAAVLVFAAFSASVMSAILPLDKLTQKVDEWAATKQAAADKAKAAAKSYSSQIEKNIIDNTKLIATEKEKLKLAAQQAVPKPVAGSKKVLDKLSVGGLDALSALDKRNLDKALKPAIAEFDKTGKITKGIFKGMSGEIVKDIDSAFKKVQTTVKTTEGRWKLSFRNMSLAVKSTAAVVASSAAKASAAFVSAIMTMIEWTMKLLRVLALIGIAEIFYEMYLQAKKYLNKILESVMKFLDFLMTPVSAFMQMLGADFPDDPFAQLYKGSKLQNWALDVEAAARAQEKYKESLESISSTTKNLGTDLDSYINGLERLAKVPLPADGSGASGRLADLSKKRLTFAATASGAFGDQLTAISKLKPEDQKAKMAELMPEIERFAQSMGAAREILKKPPSEWPAAFELLGEKSALATAELKAYDDLAGKFSETMAGGNATSILYYVETLQKQADAADKSAAVLGEYSDKVGAFKELMTSTGKDTEQFATALRININNIEALKDAQSELNIARLNEQQGTSYQREMAKIANDETAAKIALAQTEEQINGLILTKAGLQGENLEIREQEIAALQRTQREQKASLDLLESERDLKEKIAKLNDQIRAAQFDQQMLNHEKTLLDLTQKQLGYRKQLLDIKQKEAELQIEGDLRQERSDNMFAFLTEEKRAAEARYQMELDLKDEKLAFIENEKNAKLEMIDLEYALLDAKMLQTQLELQKIAEDQKLKPEERDRASALATRIEGARAELPGMQQQGEEVITRGAALATKDLLNNIDKLKEARNDLQDIKVLGTTVTESFSSGMASAFNSIIQGTSSVKDAFKNMAVSVLQALAQVLARMMMVQLIGAAMGMFAPTAQAAGQVNAATGAAKGLAGSVNPMADGLIKIGPAGRTGGIMSNGVKLPGYSQGGIASGSQAGYPALLHGTEAVVPLPNGRSIPVEMSGGGTNNVSVNVNVSGSSTAETSMQSDNKQAGNLGKAIAMAVQEELQRQKRPGGILSPYGAA